MILKYGIGLACILTLFFSGVQAQKVDDGVQQRREMANMTNIKRGQQGANTFLVVIDANGRKIDGDYGQKYKENWIAVTGFSQLSTVDSDDNSDEPSVTLGDLKVIKPIDASSARLLEAMIEGEKLKKVDVVVMGRDEENQEVEKYLIRLEDVTIASMKTSLKTGGALQNSVIQEEIVFSYERIFWSYKEGISAYQASTKD